MKSAHFLKFACITGLCGVIAEAGSSSQTTARKVSTTPPQSASGIGANTTFLPCAPTGFMSMLDGIHHVHGGRHHALTQAIAWLREHERKLTGHE